MKFFKRDNFTRLSGLFIFAVILSFLLSCADNQLPVYVQLGDLRVLGLKLDTPEVAPGATVALTPILSDLNGGGRALTYSLSGCIDPGVSYGAEPDCAGSLTEQVIATNQAVTGLVAPDYTDVTPSISVTLPNSTVMFAGRNAIERYNGVSYLLVYRVSSGDGDVVVSFKRVVASERLTLNSNPTLTDILANGSSLLAAPTNTSTLSADFSSTDRETYTVKNEAGTLISETESLLTTWFISDGEVKFYRTENYEGTEYSPPSTAPASHNLIFVAVVRDGRGGLNYIKKAF